MKATSLSFASFLVFLLGISTCPAQTTPAKVQYNFAVYWTEVEVKEPHLGPERATVISGTPEYRPSTSRPQHIRSVTPDKLPTDSDNFQVWKYVEKKACKIKLASKSMADLSNLAIKYRIHYYADGYRTNPVHASSETKILALKGNVPHEFQTIPVELTCIETQRLIKNKRSPNLVPGPFPQGPVSRSKGEIKGVSLVILHQGKVVHQYASGGVKPEDAIKE